MIGVVKVEMNRIVAGSAGVRRGQDTASGVYDSHGGSEWSPAIIIDIAVDCKAMLRRMLCLS